MKLNTDKTLKRLAAILLSICLAMPLHAEEEGKEKKKEKEPAKLGLSTDFGNVFIENLGIGQIYKLREIAGTPLKVTNNSTYIAYLKIDANVPTEKMITRKRLNVGFRPIPSVNWISIGQEDFILPPGETAFTDIIIEIPNDPALYGKKFQASIHSHTVGQGFLKLGVWSHFLFTIVDSPEDQAKMDANRKRGIRKRADFTLLPDKLYIEKAPLGREFNVRKENKRTIKIANSGEEPVTVSVKVVQVKDSPLSMQSGFEAGSIAWFRPKKELFEIDVDSFVDPGWTLHLPDDPKLKQKKFMFVIKVEPADKEVIGFTFFGQIYVEVE